ncbi:MAG: ABC transporter ATP-binding protein [bacterium]
MTTFQKILTYTKKYWKRLSLSIATATLYGLFSAAPTYVIRDAVDKIFGNKSTNLIIPFILLFILLFTLKGVFMYMSHYFMNWVGNKVVNDIRDDLFKKIIHFPMSFFKEEKTTGELMSHFLNDIQMIQQASSSAIKNGARSFFEAIFLIGVAFTQNFKLAFLMMLIGPLIGITIKKVGRAVKKASTNIQNKMGSVSSAFQETFVGIKEIKAFNAEKTESKRIANLLTEYFVSTMKNVKIEALAPAFVESIAMFGSSFVFYIAAIQIMNGTITPGQLTSFFAALLLSYQPLKRLISVYTEIQYGLAAGDRIFILMEKVYPATQNRNLILNEFNNSIEIKNLSFRYNDKTQVLQNLNLQIKKGETVGLIGSSGSGKSTFCDLILAFLNPTNGQIIIDGKDITNITYESLRNQIGYVGQHTFLFNDTINANVSYSKQNATQQEIINACKAAHAHEFIEQLPNGYETIVGENGTLLSGGQKQRLTIARALLKNPEILIFDEATSSLDQKSENMIKLALDEICKHKTVIIISHRLYFIEKMNRILKIQNKNIIEITKQDLAKQIEQQI